MTPDDYQLEYHVYSADGRMVSRGVTTGKETRITAPKGVYVVKVGKNVFKIF